MIRPFTLVCMVSAFGAGLYLYQCKHQAQVLDRDIAKTIKQTEAARERIGMLRAEWALLNEPDRLSDLAKAHTTLQTLKPTQFVAMNDLASRLPPPSQRPEPVEAEPEEAMPRVADAAPAPSAQPLQTQPLQTRLTQTAAAAAEPKPVGEPRPAGEPRPIVAAEAKPADPSEARPSAAPHHAPRPAPVQVAHAEPPVRAARAPAVFASSDATAPGTVGAAVLRAMRERASYQERPYVQPAAASSAPAYATPAYVARPYSAPSYPTTSYAPAYAAPATTSMLGGSRGALPPPVPFAAR